MIERTISTTPGSSSRLSPLHRRRHPPIEDEDEEKETDEVFLSVCPGRLTHSEREQEAEC